MNEDLISRQAAIDALESIGSLDTNADREYARSVFETLPSVQPEIVRCKNCKDYQTDWETSYSGMHYCATMDTIMPDDAFCSYAERRTDE